MTRSEPVAVLGAGIMGACLALALARRGRAVTVFDRASRPLAGASRWNEGKIHLGYLYGADPTLETARRLLPGGLLFAPLLDGLAGTDVRARATAEDDHFLVHPASVAGAEAIADRFAALDGLVAGHPDARHYLADVSRAASRRLSRAEIARFADPDAVVAGFRVPERSVDTQWVADRLCDALAAAPGITLRTETAVRAARPVEAPDGPWRVETGDGDAERFGAVVNALWNGRLAVDVTAGLATESEWSHRYRLSLFVRTRRPVPAPSAVLCVGPFGDVKAYGDRDFYLSWYPAGLRLESEAIDPPAPPPLDAAATDALVAGVRAGLAPFFPAVAAILDAAETIRCDGGFVFAQGKGSLGDPGSSLHRRDRFGIRRRGRYLSVDTGKYSTAPWLADHVARELAGE